MVENTKKNTEEEEKGGMERERERRLQNAHLRLMLFAPTDEPRNFLPQCSRLLHL